ncbi:MAG: type II toxin-antitoxin system VapC family toxin [Bacteroidetes bacterium]|nr:MAG: type II toxin-antitoxin system VapC family toxin [Bacteroidota bacterium]
MNLLLAPHTFIWFVENDSRLPDTTKLLIELEENDIFLSIASLWEITIKRTLGKLHTTSSLQKILEQVSENGFELIPILPEHLLTLNSLEYFHRDPFDRIIISQGIREKYPVVSKDELFDKYAVQRIWDG